MAWKSVFVYFSQKTKCCVCELWIRRGAANKQKRREKRVNDQTLIHPRDLHLRDLQYRDKLCFLFLLFNQYLRWIGEWFYLRRRLTIHFEQFRNFFGFIECGKCIFGISVFEEVVQNSLENWMLQNGYRQIVNTSAVSVIHFKQLSLRPSDAISRYYILSQLTRMTI